MAAKNKASRSTTREPKGPIQSVVQFLNEVFDVLKEWELNRPHGEAGVQPWFRGEAIVETPLLPKLYRRSPPFRENDLLQHFRRLATVPHFNAGIERGATDLWLYLARHSGLPTRLLDWTEGALTALYFAIAEDRGSRVWMLMPQPLNIASGLFAFDLPWVPGTRTNLSIRAAWELDQTEGQADLPIALYPMHVHPRLQVQRSCFTIHGRRKESLASLMAEVGLATYLRSFNIDPNAHISLRRQLGMAGITQASLFPDLDGLASDLTSQLWTPGGGIES